MLNTWLSHRLQGRRRYQLLLRHTGGRASPCGAVQLGSQGVDNSTRAIRMTFMVCNRENKCKRKCSRREEA